MHFVLGLVIFEFKRMKRDTMKKTACMSILVFAGLASVAQADEAKKDNMTTKPTTVYDFSVKDIDGNAVKLDAYRGKVLLVVNVASRCGYTKRNYKELEPLYRKNKDKGFEVLAFPANNFMGQEPGSNAEIKQFCTKRFDVSFPLFAKVSVKGKDICPLYAFLTSQPDKDLKGDIKWNFEKFLISRDGEVIARFSSSTAPSDTRLITAVEKALNTPASGSKKG
jgi:glutathione peroxidase